MLFDLPLIDEVSFEAIWIEPGCRQIVGWALPGLLLAQDVGLQHQRVLESLDCTCAHMCETLN